MTSTSPTQKTAQAPAIAVTPTDGAKSKSTASHSLTRFHISSIAYEGSTADVENFDVVLNPHKHGIFDLIDAAFQHSLTKLTGGKCIESHLWTVLYGNKTFKSFMDESIRDLYSPNTFLCTYDEPRVFASEAMKALVALEKNTKGIFSLDHVHLKFKFTLEDVRVPQSHKAYGDGAMDIPKCYAAASVTQFNAGKSAEYVTPVEQAAVVQLTQKYADFYKGANGWTRCRRTMNFKPSKPIAPDWNRDELVIMGLFINAGWKFAHSWKFGLQFAFPHRSKSATQGKWYVLNKNCRYMIQYDGENMTADEKIISAKKKCKEMMKEFLDHGPPQPIPRPMGFAERRERMLSAMYNDDDDFASYLENGQNYNSVPLPKRHRAW